MLDLLHSSSLLLLTVSPPVSRPPLTRDVSLLSVVLPPSSSPESPCHCSILLLNSCSTAEGFNTNSGGGAASAWGSWNLTLLWLRTGVGAWFSSSYENCLCGFSGPPALL